MKKKNKKPERSVNNFGKRLLSFVIHLIMITLTAVSFLPIARLYFNHLPPMGSDFYQTSTYFSYFNRFMSWPHLAWKYIWYNGVPAVFDYPWLHMYPGAVLINFFTSGEANEIYSLATLFLYFVFSYLLFYRLSKNKIFSVFLASLLIWSRSAYVALFGAGAGAFSANLMFAPLAFYLLHKYFDSRKRKWLLLTATISGLSIMGHQGMSILFIAIPSFLIILFDWAKETKFFSVQKFKDLIIYGLILILTGGLGLYPYALSFLGSIFGFETNMGLETSAWPRKEALKDLFGYQNIALFISLALVFIFVLIQRKLGKSLRRSISFISLIIYLIIFEALMYIGKNPFSETLGADRAYWFLPLAIGGLMAIFFQGINADRPAAKKISFGFIMKALIIVALSVGFISAPNLYWFIKEKSGLARLMIPTENLLFKPSAANKREVVPDWINTQEKNYRLHTTAAVATWWNILYDLPVTTGYADPQGVKARSWAYWRDTSITSESVEHFKVPYEIAEQNAFFLVDWYAIKYLEYSNQGFSPPKYLFENPDFVKKDEPMPKTAYHFYEANEKYYSPIIRPTNAPTILVISQLEAYNSLLRVLAQENINSKQIIPIHYSEYLDDINKLDLSRFDAIMLYDYRYRKEKNFKSYPQKPWKNLLNYVENGGKLLIETGSEVKESDIKNLPVSGLPEVFPIKTTVRGELGENWDLSVDQNEFLDNVDQNSFDKLIYQASPWKLSYTEPSQLKSWAKKIFCQKGNPILVFGSLGKGKVVWSGINLPYHIKSYNNISEGKLFKNLIGWLVVLKDEQAIPFSFKLDKSEEILLESQAKAGGVLFKESNYGGWLAKVGGKTVRPMEAGVGMMYFPITLDKGTKIEVVYRGLTIYWIMFIVALLTIFLIILYIILGKRFSFGFNKLFKFDKIMNKTKSWWERDEDEK